MVMTHAVPHPARTITQVEAEIRATRHKLDRPTTDPELRAEATQILQQHLDRLLLERKHLTEG